MSDFIDRLAARAIGGEAALAPRLPSLFEPLQRAPVMAMADEGEAPVRARDTGPMPPAASATTPPPSPPVPAKELIEARAARTASAEQAPLPLPGRAATDTPPAPMPPPRAAAPVRAMAAEPSRVTPVSERTAATPSPVSPRESRIAPSRHEAAHPPTAAGALLPAPAPVFATTNGLPASSQPDRAAAMRRPRDVPAGRESRTSSEPVVHISIGRLEVRAAPTAAAPPRRRDGPRPSSLDDYLRQRGKATP
ncbi:hypothetical protein [Rhodanobacter lindaniclasticus]|jgi:hypothetical protein|uniref:Uncharacterized protein n=1 Tax=Rhodanobacter lindaniclasticus TaxID=75310 RepID=A0A4V3USD0_9GAMM|nr:hypothetical protein [Rhodanobacter lindaniclasticus]THD06281.1 hypothetical protein B1991_13775 [Rhodanobacter lindaniclasticus]